MHGVMHCDGRGQRPPSVAAIRICESVMGSGRPESPCVYVMSLCCTPQTFAKGAWDPSLRSVISLSEGWIVSCCVAPDFLLFCFWPLGLFEAR